MFKPIVIILSALTLPATSYAMFCPNNFKQIEIGDTIETVTAICGEPSTKKTKEVENPGPQEWSYFLPQNAPIGGASATSASGASVLKTSVYFNEDGVAISINVNGIGVGSTTICGANIQLGDTRDRVKSICGKPKFIYNQEETNDQGQPAGKKQEITEYTYSTNPPVTLIFQNGILKETK